MNPVLRIGACLYLFIGFLQAETPDISNLDKCIDEVCAVNRHSPAVANFGAYAQDYPKLLIDLQAALPNLPYLYQEAAVKPLIVFLDQLGKEDYLKIINGDANDEHSIALREILPDAALAILTYESSVSHGIYAFQEIVGDLYDSFLSKEKRANIPSGTSIEPPNYGVIPPLVTFGNQAPSPYTWPADAANYLIGMDCGIVQLPSSQIEGGLLAWSSLGHETGGHDLTHADAGLLDDLAEKVYTSVLKRFGSKSLANYWARCINACVADVCGYLHAGPTLGISLLGYLRALGKGKLRTAAYLEDSHPIDLLRVYLAAAVVKRLPFKEAGTWSHLIAEETKKDDGTLYLIDPEGNYRRFPVPFDRIVASTEAVAKTILTAQLDSLQGHSLQELVDWNDDDQQVIEQMLPLFKSGNTQINPSQILSFRAAYITAGAAQAALESGSDPSAVFKKMQTILTAMHLQNPLWSSTPTDEAQALLEHTWKGSDNFEGKEIARQDLPEPPPAFFH